MKNRICAAIAIALIASTPLASALAAGPRPSSLDNWPGMMNSTPPANVPPVSPFEGPRPSSLDNWPGMTQGTAPAPQATSQRPQYVLDGYYVHGGKWREHYVPVN